MTRASAVLLHEDAGDLTRRERRKLEVRGRILEAATALFEERGYAATSVEEICARADVAYKTLFNHFPSKRALLRETAQVHLQRLLDMIAEAAARPGTVADRLRAFFASLADRLEETGPMRRELMTELVHVAHEARTEAEQARRLHDAFGAILRRGAAAGELTTTHSVETLTEVVVGVFYALTFNWANLEDYAVRTHARAAAEFLADAVRAPARGRRNG